MKRLLLLIAVAALASCSDIANDVDGGVTTPSDDATQVSFTASISSETRVTGDPETFEPGDAIKVSAFTNSSITTGFYTPSDTETYTYADGSFTSLDPITREDAFQELTYLAVYPAASFSSLDESLFELIVKTDQSVEGNLELSDLLIATVFESTETTPALTFDHALSCLTITFEGKNGEDLVGFYGLDEAKLTVSAKAITYVNMYNNNLDYLAMFDAEDLTAAYIGENSFKVFFAPQTITEGTGLATITFGNKTFTWEAKNDISFESGERYNYTWKIDTDGMTVTGTTYDVTFNSNGTEYDSQMVAEDGTAVAPADPSMDGATFIGWYTDAALTEIYDFSTAVTGDITLTAKYWDNSATALSIYNVTELCTFRDFTNLGMALDTDITLERDIDLSGVCGEELGNWTPIADYYASSTAGSYYYTGTFDGQDHSISNMYMYATSLYCRALFGSIGGGAVIKNVHVKDIYTYATDNKSNHHAAIAGLVTTGTAYVTNCTTTGGSIYGSNQNGGIVGICKTGQIFMEDCHNYGTSVSSVNNYPGGIIGVLSSTGTAAPSQVVNCSNSGTISGLTGVGGIASEANYGAKIIGCTNSGTLAKNTTAALNQGGIVGSSGVNVSTATTGCTIIACINTGEISSTATTAVVGGIMGYASKASTITSCYSNCTISASAAGGIMGSGSYTLTANYYVGTPTAGIGSGVTSDQAVKCSTISDFLSDYVTVMNTACSSYGYEFTYNDGNNPTLSAIE